VLKRALFTTVSHFENQNKPMG